MLLVALIGGEGAEACDWTQCTTLFLHVMLLFCKGTFNEHTHCGEYYPNNQHGQHNGSDRIDRLKKIFFWLFPSPLARVTNS